MRERENKQRLFSCIIAHLESLTLRSSSSSSPWLINFASFHFFSLLSTYRLIICDKTAPRDFFWSFLFWMDVNSHGSSITMFLVARDSFSFDDRFFFSRLNFFVLSGWGRYGIYLKFFFFCLGVCRLVMYRSREIIIDHIICTATFFFSLPFRK